MVVIQRNLSVLFTTISVKTILVMLQAVDYSRGVPHKNLLNQRMKMSLNVVMSGGRASGRLACWLLPSLPAHAALPVMVRGCGMEPPGVSWAFSLYWWTKLCPPDILLVLTSKRQKMLEVHLEVRRTKDFLVMFFS